MVGVEVQLPSEADFEVWPVGCGWGLQWNGCGAKDRIGEQNYVSVNMRWGTRYQVRLGLRFSPWVGGVCCSVEWLWGMRGHCTGPAQVHSSHRPGSEEEPIFFGG